MGNKKDFGKAAARLLEQHSVKPKEVVANKHLSSVSQESDIAEQRQEQAEATGKIRDKSDSTAVLGEDKKTLSGRYSKQLIVFSLGLIGCLIMVFVVPETIFGLVFNGVFGAISGAVLGIIMVKE